jgi:cobalt-zinc-cadmium efflux system outer membrane protein
VQIIGFEKFINERKILEMIKSMQWAFHLIFCILLLCSQPGFSQSSKIDTVIINIHEAEKLFVEKNLQILAQKYNVDATKALIIQARLYPNPNLNGTQGAYNKETAKWFETNASGELAFQFSQLIVLSHKIKKQVKIAETNYKLAEDALADLLVTLKLALRGSFYNIYYLQPTAKVYDEEINALKVIVAAYKEVEGKGYVSEAEIVQIQAQLYSLQNEYQTLIDNINDQESQLRLLLRSSPEIYYKPEIKPEIINENPLKYSFKTFLDSAYANRTDLRIAKDNLLLSQQTYTYQKALAIPDLTIGTNWDRHGSYVTDFNAVSLGIDIPIFNRNQGNIKNAQILINYNNTQLQFTQSTLEEQVSRGLQKAIDADKLYKGIDPSFATKFDNLAKEMFEHYMKRNVNLLTFLTFYDSYKQNIVQLNTIQYNKVYAMENLNFLTDTEFFNK